jgi:hypothetical protein
MIILTMILTSNDKSDAEKIEADLELHWISYEPIRFMYRSFFKGDQFMSLIKFCSEMKPEDAKKVFAAVNTSDARDRLGGLVQFLKNKDARINP